jgi:hypothetical protein
LSNINDENVDSSDDDVDNDIDDDADDDADDVKTTIAAGIQTTGEAFEQIQNCECIELENTRYFILENDQVFLGGSNDSILEAIAMNNTVTISDLVTAAYLNQTINTDFNQSYITNSSSKLEWLINLSNNSILAVKCSCSNQSKFAETTATDILNDYEATSSAILNDNEVKVMDTVNSSINEPNEITKSENKFEESTVKEPKNSLRESKNIILRQIN